MRAFRAGWCLLLASGFVGVSGAARADEPVSASEPRLMSETAEITSVVDAFDKDDPFDLNLMVGIRQEWKSAQIHRETSLFQPGLTTGGYVSGNENIAKFSGSRTTLDVGGDIGIYKDLALVIRVPVILSDSSSLSDLNGSSSNPQLLQDPTGAQLFKVPFHSPTRSGVDWFSVGLDWAIFNQQRDTTKPTWLVGVTGRFAIGTPLHACNADAAVQCPDPINASVNRDPGISRGMNGINAHTIFSKRYGYVEPYSGLDFLAEFANGAGSNDFAASNTASGNLVDHPPLLGSFIMGVEIVPWEQREQFQRLAADFRVVGTYHSPGREYSELFDALGSSQAPSLRTPNPGAYTASGNGSVQDPSAQKVYFTGITDQQAFGSIHGSAGVTWQAGEYIKFNAGFGLGFNQSHLLTSADPCNPGGNATVGTAGPCHTAATNGNTFTTTTTGIPNPNSRAVIDSPGNRFSVDNTVITSLWLSAVVMF
jgi:hypothetical protein